MATPVATGQITIFDNNDARSVHAAITASSATAQSYKYDNGNNNFNPNWASTALVLTANISISGLTASETLARLKNRKFTTTVGGSAITGATTVSTSPAQFVNSTGAAVSTPFATANTTDSVLTAPTLTISANLSNTNNPSWNVYFEADYVDPVTAQSTHIVAGLNLTSIAAGAAAIWVETIGQDVIKKSNTTAQEVTAIAATLMRQGVRDSDNLTYKWYEYAVGSSTATQINTSLNTKYAMKSTDLSTTSTPTATSGEIGSGLPTGTASTTNNTLVIGESAVLGLRVYRVEITDSAENATYSANFTIVDKSDPYTVTVNSSKGQVFQNGVGTTVLTPVVYNGNTKITVFTGWTFDWNYYDKDGNIGGFVGTTKMASGAGVAPTANSGTGITVANDLAVGDLIKILMADGVTAYFAQVATQSASSITIGALSGNNLPLASSAAVKTTTTGLDLTGGRIFHALPKQTGTSLSVSDKDIDSRGSITVTANKPQ